MIDRHHILNDRVSWTTRPQGTALREVPSLIPQMDRAYHEELHAACPPVPMLGYYALMIVQSTFNEGHNTLSSMDNLMASIEWAAENPRTHELESELCYLAIRAIDLQRPFIREGMVKERKKR